ncbi:hypothetical protein SAMD00023353_1500340 [Rosellinia necatrix]|uniref:SprT-like domain-containing protein n=1 Tax=Rosellinia necatrix TaxID=77044 RepID=A0A1W2TJ18_ROSNE|nr:hypothetical protein SAMD00023353_1500340 [Rosellinia necatrix]
MMAGWDAGGTEMLRSLSDSAIPSPQYYDSFLPLARKRQFHHTHQFDITDDIQILREWKRPRIRGANDNGHAVTRCDPQSVPAFFIIKEATQSARTGSLGSLEYNPPIHNDSTGQYIYGNMSNLQVRNEQEPTSTERLLETKNNDDHNKAARLAETNMAGYRRRRRSSQHERILKSLISPKALSAEFEIDDAALEGIFSATNEIFFGGSLKGRVAWIWEDLPTNLIGTTAWRDAPNGNGYETLIFLSRQILRNKKYNRRLLIATFIHELIHSYLFVKCGYHPDDCGGHTSGFKRIANLINNWVGEENLLQLHKMEAELSDFEIRTAKTAPRDHIPNGCQVQWLCDGTLGYIVPRPSLRLQGRDPLRG